MTALKIMRYAAWTAIAVLVASMAVYGLSGPPLVSSTAVRQSGTAAVGGPFELSTIDGKSFTEANVRGRPYRVLRIHQLSRRLPDDPVRTD